MVVMGVILFIALSVFFTLALVVASKDTSDMNTRLDDEDQLRYLEEWAKSTPSASSSSAMKLKKSKRSIR